MLIFRLSVSFSHWLCFPRAGIKDLLKWSVPGEHGQIERIVLLSLRCYWTVISHCNTSPCWSLCFDKQKKPSLSLSLSLWLLTPVWYALHVQTEILLFGPRRIKCNQNAALLFVSAARSYLIAIILSLRALRKAGWMHNLHIYDYRLRGNRKPVFLSLSLSLSPLLFSVCLTSPLHQPSAFFLQTLRP